MGPEPGLPGPGRGAGSSSFAGEATPRFDQCSCFTSQVQGQLPGPRGTLLDCCVITEQPAPRHRPLAAWTDGLSQPLQSMRRAPTSAV